MGIIRKIKQILKTDKNSQPSACRSVQILPDDTFIVSYPKSGNTWFRFLVANLIYLERQSVTFSNIEKLVPDIYVNTQEELLSISTPRFIKSHEYFDPRYPKVIYIVRDPRDVAVSYYHHLIKECQINEDYSIDSWIKPFVAGEFNPQFGTWAENVGSWLGARKDKDDFLLISYEELLNNSLKTMQIVASFLGLATDENQLKQVIELSSADRMRELEIKEKWQPHNNMRMDKPFVRAAKSRNWETDLSKQAIAHIEDTWQPLMKKLKYLN